VSSGEIESEVFVVVEVVVVPEGPILVTPSTMKLPELEVNLGDSEFSNEGRVSNGLY